MTGLTNYTSNNVLNYVTGQTAMPTLPAAWLALFTVAGTDAGTGFTEVSGGSYVRMPTAGVWTAAVSGPPSIVANGGSGISFPISTAPWGTVIAWGLYDASTSGNLLAWDYLGSNPWFPFTCTGMPLGIINAVGITTGSTPNLLNGASVVFNAEYGGALPAGLTGGVIYTVTDLVSDTFTTGAPITTRGSGMVRQVTSLGVSVSSQVVFSVSTLTIASS